MKTLNITETFKMTDVLGFTQGYYRLADGSLPLLLQGRTSNEQVQIKAGTVVKLEDSIEYSAVAKVIINCTNDVAYYVESIFQDGDKIIFDFKDGDSGSGGGDSNLVGEAVVGTATAG